MYPAGKTCDDFQDATFTPVFEVDFTGDPDGEAAANTACAAATSDYTRKICIFDYFVTRSEAFAQATLNAAIEAERNNEAAG